MPNPREYGLSRDYKTVGVPRVKKEVTSDDAKKETPIYCPNCGCRRLFSIEVDIEMKLLRGGKGIGVYVGCPACPWASPMVGMTTADAPAPGAFETHSADPPKA